MTQEQLAAESGAAGVSMIESGQRAEPRRKTLEKIAKALSRRLGTTITVEDLTRPVDYEPPPADLVDDTLQRFRASGMAEITDEEAAELRAKTPWPYGPPSVAGWYHALQFMRATKRED